MDSPNKSRLSIATDYFSGTGSPRISLKHISEAGFTYIHWCHQWETDFFYSRPEIEQIRKWLKEFKLNIYDMHSSAGVEKNWVSPNEYERLAGIGLVKNRMEMIRKLGGDVIVLHVPTEPDSELDKQYFWERLHTSIADLMPFSKKYDVKIAFENHAFGGSNIATIARLLREYTTSSIGFCYDSGHENIRGISKESDFPLLQRRMLAVHINDNDGFIDQHNLPFTGNVDWTHVTDFIAGSVFNRPLTLEVKMRSYPIEKEKEFLKEAYVSALRIANEIEKTRSIT